MKIKVEFDYEELEQLAEENTAQDIIAEAHEMLNLAIERRTESTKCVITVDSNKEE